MRVIAAIVAVVAFGIGSRVHSEDPKPEHVRALSFEIKPNTVGPFAVPSSNNSQLIHCSIRVEEVLDKNRLIATILIPSGRSMVPAKQRVLISNYDTSKLADGQTFTSKVYRVVGTEKIGTKTYMHVEQWDKPHEPLAK
jgi:hypothetical protein